MERPKPSSDGRSGEMTLSPHTPVEGIFDPIVGRIGCLVHNVVFLNSVLGTSKSLTIASSSGTELGPHLLAPRPLVQSKASFTGSDSRLRICKHQQIRDTMVFIEMLTHGCHVQHVMGAQRVRTFGRPFLLRSHVYARTCLQSAELRPKVR